MVSIVGEKKEKKGEKNIRPRELTFGKEKVADWTTSFGNCQPVARGSVRATK